MFNYSLSSEKGCVMPLPPVNSAQMKPSSQVQAAGLLLKHYFALTEHAFCLFRVPLGNITFTVWEIDRDNL